MNLPFGGDRLGAGGANTAGMVGANNASGCAAFYSTQAGVYEIVSVGFG
jgi:hypothetical protein